MQTKTAKQLIELNQQFYQTFALQFSSTRMRLQPGVTRKLSYIPRDAKILDLGCGNGELIRGLLKTGFNGSYLGLDFSSKLLEIAENLTGCKPGINFLHSEFTKPGWEALLPQSNFSIAFAFAFLHHLPGNELRCDLLCKVRKLLISHETTLLIISNWQFLNSPRWQSRIQPWNTIGLSPDDVDPGDTLLDWRQGGIGLRYVHHFTPTELERLASQSGYVVSESFYSDGKEGNLSLYQVWRLDI